MLDGYARGLTREELVLLAMLAWELQLGIELDERVVSAMIREECGL